MTDADGIVDKSIRSLHHFVWINGEANRRISMPSRSVDMDKMEFNLSSEKEFFDLAKK